MIVSKSEEMVDLTMAVFARSRVNGGVAEIFALHYNYIDNILSTLS
jgi:hypothetical protein